MLDFIFVAIYNVLLMIDYCSMNTSNLMVVSEE